MKRLGVGQEAARRRNLSVLLTRLHRSGPATRAELTSLMGLTRSTIGVLVTELRRLGLVVEIASKSGGSPGRPSPSVQPLAESTTVLAIMIAVDSIAVGVMGLGGVFRTLVRENRPRGRVSPDETVRAVQRLAASQLVRVSATNLRAVGVAVVGVVRSRDGFVHVAPNLGWRDVPVGDLVSSSLGLRVPVVVGNEADLGALAEHIRGAGVGAANMLYVSGEVGVGGGVIIDGKPLGGTHGYAGEIGHVTVNPQGRECGCWATGCWETEVGEAVLLERCGVNSLDEIVAAAEAGDPRVLDALETEAYWLGIGMAGLQNVFDTECVVLGGMFSRLFPYLHERVQQELSAHAIISRWSDTLMRPGELGIDSPLVGAAELAFAPFLNDPALLQQALTTPDKGVTA